MVLESFAVTANAFLEFIRIYNVLSFALDILLYSAISLAFWSIVRFVVLPFMGGNYQWDEGDRELVTDTVTTVTTDSSGENWGQHSRSRRQGGVKYTHSTNQSRNTTTTHTRSVRSAYRRKK